MISKSKISKKINGAMARINLSNEMSATPCTTNKSSPTGGVIKPMARLITMTTPKKSGSIPAFIAIGRSNGVKIVMAAEAFKKQPAINKTTLIITRIKTWLLVMPVINEANICGICSAVINHPKRFAAAMINTTKAVIFPALRKAPGISFHLRSLYTNLLTMNA